MCSGLLHKLINSQLNCRLWAPSSIKANSKAKAIGNHEVAADQEIAEIPAEVPADIPNSDTQIVNAGTTGNSAGKPKDVRPRVPGNDDTLRHRRKTTTPTSNGDYLVGYTFSMSPILHIWQHFGNKIPRWYWRWSQHFTSWKSTCDQGQPRFS